MSMTISGEERKEKFGKDTLDGEYRSRMSRLNTALGFARKSIWSRMSSMVALDGELGQARQ